MKFKEKLKKTLSNLPGWHTNRKIVVFESDDWGSIRTPNLEANQKLRKAGYDVDKCHYMKYDSLETNDDLELLFNLLTSVKSENGQHPKITANSLVANPDFDKIKNDNFENYYYEEVVETFNKYSRSQNCFELWREGFKEKVFIPQSHGREHLNISRWMRDLRNGDEEAHLLFDLNMFGLSRDISKKNRASYLAAFDGGKNELIYDRKEVVNDAFRLFDKLLGHRSKSFIAPNFVWDDEIENALFQNGVDFIQTQRARPISSDLGDKRKIKRHFTGQRNNNKQIYLVRNSEFEPSSNPNIDWVDKCLSEINIAFKFKKPAIISTHRVNFIGALDQNNRDKNLKSFEKLLKNIVQNWNDVEFLSSNELGDLIKR